MGVDERRMHIQVKLGEPLWRAVGQRRLTYEWPNGAQVTVADVLARLAAEHQGFADAYAGRGLPYRLFVDARPVAPAEPESPPATAGPSLADGQTLFILLPAIGG